MLKPEYRVATKFTSGNEDTPVRAYSGRELAGSDRIFSYLMYGGIALVSGEIPALDELLGYVNRREGDLGRLLRQELPSQRLMVEIGRHAAIGLNPPILQRYLAFLCGEEALGEGETALIPYKAIKSLQASLAQKWRVDALGTWLQAGDDVLPPRSQETYKLFRDAVTDTADRLLKGVRVLDMGCGCGVLAFIVARELHALSPSVVATDILPEAVGSVMLNLERLEGEGVIVPEQVKVASPGEFFENIEGEFDLVIFNAPWVLAPIRSRVDVALNDEKQRVLESFFAQLPEKLRPDGSLILGYADNSGEKAVSRALKLASDAGFIVGKEHSLRVATHRKRGKWERIFVWEMAREG